MALRVLVGVTLSLGETEGRSVVAAIYGCQHKSVQPIITAH